MRAGIVLAVMMVASPALAQGRRGNERLIIVEKESLEQRLADINDQLADLMARAKPKDRQALKALRREVDDLRELTGSAPEAPRNAYRIYYREGGGDYRDDEDDRRPPPALPPVVVVQQPAPVVQQPPPAPQPVVYPITELALQNLLTVMNREPSVDSRMRVLQQSAPVNYFLVGQVQQMLTRFEFGGDKLQAVRMLKPRILDPENASQLYTSFRSPSDQAELKRIFAQP